MDKNRYYFYIGGFISISLSLFFILVIIIFTSNSLKKESYALKKDNFISISLETPVSKNDLILMPKKEPIKEAVEANIEKVEPQTHQKTKKVESNKEVEKIDNIKEIEVNNLFGAIEDKSIKKINEKIKQKDETLENKILDELEKKISKSSENPVDLLSKKIEMIQNNKTSSVSSKNSTAKEVDEYITKVQMLVYENFKPPKNSANSYAKAVIELDSMGKLINFKIVSYSNNHALNLEVDKIKNRLINTLFPKNPDKISAKFVINLIPKE